MKTLNPLTKNLQRFLEKKGWTIPQFARELENADIHVDEKSVRNWYNGDNYPQTETLIQLSDFLGVSLDDLVKSDKTEFGCEKFDDLSQEEKELYTGFVHRKTFILRWKFRPKRSISSPT